MKYTLCLVIAFTISFNIESAFSQKFFRKVDEFNGSVMLTIPSLSNLSLAKYFKDNDTSIYLSLTTCGSTLNVGVKGGILLFTDSTKMVFDKEVDVKAGDGKYCNYKYSVLLRLKPEEISSICTKTIKAYRLYIYDYHLKDGEGATFLNNANLIVNAK